ncbi:MAG: GNAT family N-acetyltransferase [Acidimicrobiales bacterium]
MGRDRGLGLSYVPAVRSNPSDGPEGGDADDLVLLVARLAPRRLRVGRGLFAEADSSDLVAGTSGPAGGIDVRPGRRRHFDQILQLDQRAFGPRWRLSPELLTDALAATPRAVLYMAYCLEPDPPGGAPGAGPPDASFGRAAATVPGPGLSRSGFCGYGIFGRAARRGYVQRLAVDPQWRRRGIGRVLLLRGLNWMTGHGVQRAVVNTQASNVSALLLYQSAGFHLDPTAADGLILSMPNLAWSDQPGPDRHGPDRPGPDRPGPDRPGPDRPGPDRPGPDRRAPDRSRTRPIDVEPADGGTIDGGAG